MIDFNALPDRKPAGDALTGCFIATVETAEMKTPKPKKDGDGKPIQGKDYLNMRCGLTTGTGKSAGKIFDMLFDSEAPIPQFKLRRFVEAIGLPITGAFDLKDLPKIIIGKKFLIDVMPEKKDGVLTGRTTADVFTGDIYYSMAEASRKMEGVVAVNADNTINAADAEDSGEY